MTNMAMNVMENGRSKLLFSNTATVDFKGLRVSDVPAIDTDVINLAALASEAPIRNAADTIFTTSLAAESSIRAANDGVALLDLEASTRAAADATLQTSIDAESSIRAAIGEKIQGTLYDSAFSSGTPANSGNITLNKGKYLLFAQSYFNTNATTISAKGISISPTSATFNAKSKVVFGADAAPNDCVLQCNTMVDVSADNTPYYMVAVITFTGTSVSMSPANSDFYAVRIGH